jgi:hypothetical protein
LILNGRILKAIELRSYLSGVVKQRTPQGKKNASSQRHINEMKREETERPSYKKE